jgi:hypothetical protein
MGEIEPEKVDKEKSLAALSRITASGEFVSSPQLASFLTFAVKETLAGQGGNLKAYTIATEVLGRPASFDPQNDPIVRVEATRLRRAMERYYATDGAGDTFRITMPRGGYSVVFSELAASDTPVPSPVRPPRPASPSNGAFPLRLFLIIGGILLCTGAAVGIGWKSFTGYFSADKSPTPVPANFDPSAPLIVAPSKPASLPQGADSWVRSWKPRVAAIIIAGDEATAPLMHETSDILSRFGDLVVFDDITTDGPPADDLYRLEGRLKPGNAGMIDVRLIHPASRRTLLVRTVPMPVTDDDIETLAKRLAVTIGGRNGTLSVDALPTQTSDLKERMGPRTCLSIVTTAIRTDETDLLTAGRQCLDEMLALSANSAMLLSLSAELRLHEKDGDRAKAGLEAQRALGLDPQNVRALYVLSDVVDAKNPGLALHLGDQAVERNPYDPVLVRAQADRLVKAGLVGRAEALRSSLEAIE